MYLPLVTSSIPPPSLTLIYLFWLCPPGTFLLLTRVYSHAGYNDCTEDTKFFSFQASLTCASCDIVYTDGILVLIIL